MRRSLTIIVTAAVASLSLLVAGCGSDGDDGDDGFTNVRYADQVRTTQFAPIFVAEAKGFFEDHGVRLEGLTLDGRSALPAIVAGEVDMIGHATHGAVQLRAQGQPVQALVALQTPAANTLLVSTEAGIDDVTDLKGKRVAVTGFGGTTHDELSVILADAGLDPENDVTIVELGGDPAAYIASFERGDVDAAMTFQPAVGVLVNDLGVATPLVSLGQGEGPEILQSIATTLLVSDDFMADNPEAAQGVASAIAEAQAFMRDEANSDEVVEILEEELGMDPEELRSALKELAPLSVPEITEEMVADAHEFLRLNGHITTDEEVPYDEVVADVEFD